MLTTSASVADVKRPDSGLRALCGIAAYFRVQANPDYLSRELALLGEARSDDILRAAKIIKMKARRIPVSGRKRLSTAPSPSIIELRNGSFLVLAGVLPDGTYRVVDPVLKSERIITYEQLIAETFPYVILVARQVAGPGSNPKRFGLSWFFPSIWRYRNALVHVMIASTMLQIFALVTPLFFQIIIDKVLVHRGYETLYVLIGGLAALSVFDVVLQFLRSYALSHTTNRIDVELGRRLFHHLLNLPLGFFEVNSAGQTIARMRELESIRTFLTGQALFSVLDFAFAFILVTVLFFYSVKLTVILLLSIPVYIIVAALVRPALREKMKEKFNSSAESQQFLVEAVVGIQTIKALAVEPSMRMEWEEKLARYVRTSFTANMMAVGGQNAIQLVSKLATVLFLFFGAQAVISGELTVGGLIAFNMISAQVIQPVLRISQLWQDFQQVQISAERLGDILNRAGEISQQSASNLGRPAGAISFKNVNFSYSPSSPPVLKNINISIKPGEVVGIVGASGSGKSTLTKLIQKLYLPTDGSIFIDNTDIAHVDPSWLRSQIGVVLQENLLFNRTVHDNIALSNVANSRANVMHVARLAGADEFISRMPNGYDTIIEERGANLSGGQRQRIAIARAIITNPPIMILDEATSALDYDSERIIQDNMSRIGEGRTVVIVAHRLAAVRHCDRIISMKDGSIVESGTHMELLKNENGIYSRLWRLQSREI